MSFETIASFQNERHTYDVHKHETTYSPPHVGENAYYVVQDDDQQRGAFWDEDRAIEVAEDWAGPDAERLF